MPLFTDWFSSSEQKPAPEKERRDSAASQPRRDSAGGAFGGNRQESSSGAFAGGAFGGNRQESSSGAFAGGAFGGNRQESSSGAFGGRRQDSIASTIGLNRQTSAIGWDRQGSYDAFGAAENRDMPLRVLVRCRPASKPGGATYSLEADVAPDKVTLKLQSPDGAGSQARAVRSFNCNKYCGPQTDQRDLFEAAAPIVERTMEGHSGVIFCYGETGAGKTYTMTGPPEDMGRRLRDHDSAGIVQRVSRRMFERMRERSSKGEVFNVEASYLEIHSSDGSDEQLIDLLSEEECKLQVKPDPLDRNSFVCDGLRRVGIRTPDEMTEALAQGQRRCRFMETSKNCQLSRSHCLFMLTVECFGEGVGATGVQRGKLVLVDLAGSESLQNVDGLTKMQAVGINRVLSSLGALLNNINLRAANGNTNESALTVLLRDCVGGNNRALAIANISPDLDRMDESVRTLTFAQQLMSVKTEAKLNRVEQESGALSQMRQRHADCLRILEEKTKEAISEDTEERNRLHQEIGNLGKKVLTKEAAGKTLEEMRNEQLRKIDEVRLQIKQAMTKELDQMHSQSLKDLDVLRQSVEKQATYVADHERDSRLISVRAELEETLKTQKSIEKEASDLRVRLAAAEERANMLQARQDEYRKERAVYDDERQALRQQKEQQWHKIASLEGDLQKLKTEADLQRTELERLRTEREEEGRQMHVDRENWKALEAGLQQDIKELTTKVERAKHEAEMQALRVESERKQAATDLHSKIDRMEAEAAVQVEQLNAARRMQEHLESRRDEAQQREDALSLQNNDLKKVEEELDAATKREEELMIMLHQMQEGILQQELNARTTFNSTSGSFNDLLT